VWRKPKEWKSITQKKSLGNNRNQDGEVQSKSFSQKPFSLKFQTLAKTQNRLFNLNSKTSFDCCKNTREYENIRTKNLF